MIASANHDGFNFCVGRGFNGFFYTQGQKGSSPMSRGKTTRNKTTTPYVLVYIPKHTVAHNTSRRQPRNVVQPILKCGSLYRQNRQVGKTNIFSISLKRVRVVWHHTYFGPFTSIIAVRSDKCNRSQLQSHQYPIQTHVAQPFPQHSSASGS